MNGKKTLPVGSGAMLVLELEAVSSVLVGEGAGSVLGASGPAEEEVWSACVLMPMEVLVVEVEELITGNEDIVEEIEEREEIAASVFRFAALIDDPTNAVPVPVEEGSLLMEEPGRLVTRVVAVKEASVEVKIDPTAIPVETITEPFASSELTVNGMPGRVPVLIAPAETVPDPKGPVVVYVLVEDVLVIVNSFPSGPVLVSVTVLADSMIAVETMRAVDALLLDTIGDAGAVLVRVFKAPSAPVVVTVVTKPGLQLVAAVREIVWGLVPVGSVESEVMVVHIGWPRELVVVVDIIDSEELPNFPDAATDLDEDVTVVHIG